MNISIIIIVALAGVVLMLLIITSRYQKTLQSKKHYDQMAMLMQAERLMFEEDKVLIETEKKMLSKEIFVLKSTIEKQSIEATKIADDSETIANKYIKCRIELIKFIRPDLKESPEKLQQIRDLLDKRIIGEINLFQFVDQIEIFMDQLSREKF